MISSEFQNLSESDKIVLLKSQEGFSFSEISEYLCIDRSKVYRIWVRKEKNQDTGKTGRPSPPK